MFIGIAATMQMSQFSQISPSSIPNSGLRDKKRGNRKLTKADISMPTDFKHVVHVGWTAQKGFDLNGEEVENLNHFLERAGVSEQQLNDRETRAFIYDFIQSNNVLDSVKLENSDQSARNAPPPVPSRVHVNCFKNSTIFLALVSWNALLCLLEWNTANCSTTTSC